jgi:hypothetical protein
VTDVPSYDPPWGQDRDTTEPAFGLADAFDTLVHGSPEAAKAKRDDVGDVIRHRAVIRRRAEGDATARMVQQWALAALFVAMAIIVPTLLGIITYNLWTGGVFR